MPNPVQQSPDEVHYITCPLCEATCGLVVDVQAGQVTAIRPDAEDPFSRGYMCPKGFGLKGLHEDPDRIRVPMVRRGTEWEEVSWETAFEVIRERIQDIRSEHGADAVGIYLGNPNVHNLDAQLYVSTLMRALKSKNRFSASTMDQFPKQIVAALMYGHPMSVPVPDIDRCSYFLMLGGNPLVSNGSMMTAPNMRDRLRALRQRGGKVVVIDPVRTRTAAAADEHWFIRPGTDVWFLLGLLHTLFDEGLVRWESLLPHLSGVEEIARLAKRVSLERASIQCGIPAETIRGIARELAAAQSASVYGRMGTCTQSFGGLTTWLIDVINVATGNLDRPGGPMFPLAAAGSQNASGGRAGQALRIGRFQSRVRGLNEVLGELPVAALAEEMDVPGEGQIRAFITVAGNPVLSSPDSARLAHALTNLDFMVSVDFYLNETTRHADVFLPVPSPLERSHYDLTFYQLSVRNVAHFSESVFALPDGQMHEWEVLLHLTAALQNRPFDVAQAQQMDDALVRELVAGALGKGGAGDSDAALDALLQRVAAGPGPERMLDLLLRSGPYGDGFGIRADGLTLERLKGFPHGIDLGALRSRIPDVLRTPSKTIELAPPLFLADVEQLLAQEAMPPARNSFLLVGRRLLQSNNSWMHNVPALAKAIADPPLWMNPSDAASLGISNGDIVTVESRTGALQVRVFLTDDVMQSVVSLAHGFGHTDELTRLHIATNRPGVNYNVLSDTLLIDHTTGNAAVNGVPVEIKRQVFKEED